MSIKMATKKNNDTSLEQRVKELERKAGFIYKCIDWLADNSKIQLEIITDHTWLIKELAKRVWYYRDLCTVSFIIIIALTLFSIGLSI